MTRPNARRWWARWKSWPFAAQLATIVVVVAVIAIAIASVRSGPGTTPSARAEPNTRSSVSTTRPNPAVTTTTTRASAVTTTTLAPSTTLPGGIVALTVAEPTHADTYDRSRFTHWVDDDHDCQDARAEVLIAQTRVVTTFTTASNCTVATGSWPSPWSSVVVTTASTVDVDHTVPLANAWRSGAWAWTDTQRRGYANDLVDPGHLLAIPASENRSKGDDGPDGWRPPDRGSWCRYAQVWTQIKARWNLTASPVEWSAILEMAATC